MATNYNNILADVVFALNMAKSVDAFEAQAVYGRYVGGTAFLTDNASADWVVAQVQQAIVDVEYEIIAAVCFNEKHPERGTFMAPSSTILPGANIPQASSLGIPFIGPIAYIVEATTSYIMTPRPMQIVQWALRNDNQAYSLPDKPLVWCNAGGKLLFNAAGAVTYAPAVAKAAFIGTANIRLLDYHRTAIVAGSVFRLAGKEGAWGDMVRIYGEQYLAHMAMVQGAPNSIAMPEPSKV